MVLRCPRCNSSLFKVDKYGKNYKIKCYRTKACGWNPSQDFNETKEEKEKRVIKALAGNGGNISMQDITELMVEQNQK